MKSLTSIITAGLDLIPFAGPDVHLNAGDDAPTFQTKTHTGENFNLSSRRGHWTILYFYPKAETRVCTQQACAFRKSMKSLRDLGVEVLGVSADSVEAQAKFHEKEHLNFTLLADPDSAIIKKYGAKMPLLNLAKRWTFILDPDLKIRAVEKEADPANDPDKFASMIKNLKS